MTQTEIVKRPRADIYRRRWPVSSMATGVLDGRFTRNLDRDRLIDKSL
jgi:hypothetical protein